MQIWTCVLAVGIACFAALDAPAGERPNVLWISVEDIGPHLACYGHERAITPTFDELAERGVRYTRAFATCPVCATNRSSIITGMYPTSIGTHHMRCKATLPAHVRCFPERLREAGYYCTNNLKTDYNFPVPPLAWDDSSETAHWRGRASGQPFFAVFNLTASHESKIWPRGSEHTRLTPDVTEPERQTPASLTLPPYYPDTPKARRDWANYYENVTQVDHEAAVILQQLDEDGLTDDTIVFFWSDHGAGLPRAKRWPYDSGLRVPLIVCVPERFRERGQARPGSASSELVSFVDLAPTVLNLAGVAVPEHMQGRAFLGRDLPPPRRFAFSVRDRMDERYDLIRAVRDDRYRYLRNYMPWKPYAQRISYAEENETMKALRRLASAGELPRAAQAFMAERKPAEELYDLSSDPHELTNLAESDDPAHRAAVVRFREALADWEVRTGDLGLIPEPILRAREQDVGDCLGILQQGDCEASLSRVRAMLSPGVPVAERRRLCRQALASADPVERYWGVLAIAHMMDPDASDTDRLRDRMADTEAVVRIAAAAALYRRGDKPHTIDTISRELKSPSPWTRLHAAIALDELAPSDAVAAQALEHALGDRNEYVVRVAEWALHRVAGRPLPNLWQRR